MHRRIFMKPWFMTNKSYLLFIQDSISDWDMPENTELKDYGRLLKDGELRIKAHDDHKIKVRYIPLFIY